MVAQTGRTRSGRGTADLIRHPGRASEVEHDDLTKQKHDHLAQCDKLLEAHYAGAIPLGQLKSEQVRIGTTWVTSPHGSTPPPRTTPNSKLNSTNAWGVPSGNGRVSLRVTFVVFFGTTGPALLPAIYADRLKTWTDWNDVSVRAQGN